MAITDEELGAANRRGAAKRQAFPAVVDVRYDRRISHIMISLASGLQLVFAPRDVQGLQHARPADLADAEISPSGLGVHFPHLDADIYLPALLDGFLGSRRWMAAQMGKTGQGNDRSESRRCAPQRQIGRPAPQTARIAIAASRLA